MIVDDDKILVRNYFMNHHVAREQVDFLGRGRPSFGQGETITLETGRASIPLDLLVSQQRAFPEPKRPSSTYRRRENARRQLSLWAAGVDR